MSYIFNEEAEKIKASEKLNKEHQEHQSKYDRYAKVMAPDTLKALLGFIKQDVEFAEAVNQNSQTFGDCMASVAKNIKGAISDFEAFKKAVQFYFPGAEIEYQMKIKLNPYESSASTSGKTEFKTLSLLDILDE